VGEKWEKEIGKTHWASHFMGPPWCFYPPSIRMRWSHIPREMNGRRWCGRWGRGWAGLSRLAARGSSLLGCSSVGCKRLSPSSLTTSMLCSLVVIHYVGVVFSSSSFVTLELYCLRHLCRPRRCGIPPAWT
jgi:hypothetical protein